jgi:hypothetical protein
MGAHPVCCNNGYWASLSRIKHLGHGVDHPPPFSAEVKERVVPYLCSPLWTFMVSYSVNVTFTMASKLNIHECKEEGLAEAKLSNYRPWTDR